MIHKHYQISVKLLFPVQTFIRPRVCIFRSFYVVINIIINLIIENYVGSALQINWF